MSKSNLRTVDRQNMTNASKYMMYQRVNLLIWEFLIQANMVIIESI